MFLLPMNTIMEINRMCRNFLWNEPDGSTSQDLITYEEICLPYKDGGLGIRNLETVNRAAIMRNLWFVVSKKKTF